MTTTWSAVPARQRTVALVVALAVPVDLVEQLAAAMAGPLPCQRCGADAPPHECADCHDRLCPECARRCGRCGLDRCRAANDELCRSNGCREGVCNACRDDGRTLCAGCAKRSRECWRCGDDVDPAHMVVCQACQHRICCWRQCHACHEGYCPEDLDADGWCPACQQQCAVCEGCGPIDECGWCGEGVCNDCLDTCDLCLRAVCQGHLEPCQKCGTGGCPACTADCRCGAVVCCGLWECEDCGEAVCGDCAGECRDCERSLCCGERCRDCLAESAANSSQSSEANSSQSSGANASQSSGANANDNAR